MAGPPASILVFLFSGKEKNLTGRRAKAFFRPSLETFGKLLAHAEQFGSFDGGDQGLFNSYFSDWSTADISRILPFGYNVHAASTYTYAPAYKVFILNFR